MQVEDACIAKPRKSALWQRWVFPAVQRGVKQGDAPSLAGVLDSSVGTTHFLISDPTEQMPVVFLLSLMRA